MRTPSDPEDFLHGAATCTTSPSGRSGSWSVSCSPQRPPARRRPGLGRCCSRCSTNSTSTPRARARVPSRTCCSTAPSAAGPWASSLSAPSRLHALRHQDHAFKNVQREGESVAEDTRDCLQACVTRTTQRLQRAAVRRSPKPRATGCTLFASLFRWARLVPRTPVRNRDTLVRRSAGTVARVAPGWWLSLVYVSFCPAVGPGGGGPGCVSWLRRWGFTWRRGW